MDKFKQLETFVAVAALGSLTAAARVEGIAPAMIGRRMNDLEARLGVKLMNRTTRRLSLTEEGGALLEEAQRILRDLTETESRISQGSVCPEGLLRVSAPAGFGRRHVAPAIPEFARHYPEVMVTLDLSDRLVDLIEERYDCAIRIGDLDDSQYVGTRLADNQRVIVAAPNYLKQHGRPMTPDDLGRHNCLSFGQQGNQAKGWLLKHNGKVRPFRVKGSLNCSDGSVLHQWTLAGLGLSWRSLWEVREDIEQGKLITVLDSFAAPANGIYAIRPERKHVPLRVKLFIEHLKLRYQSADYWLHA